MSRLRPIIADTVLAAVQALNLGCSLDASAPLAEATDVGKRKFCGPPWFEGEIRSRTELRFGLSRPMGPDVTEEEFQRFVDSEVTPRFSDGLTLLGGAGQSRDAGGTLIREKSKVLILLYSFTPERNRAVEEIRERYQQNFRQASVLRTDALACVSF